MRNYQLLIYLLVAVVVPTRKKTKIANVLPMKPFILSKFVESNVDFDVESKLNTVVKKVYFFCLKMIQG